MISHQGDKPSGWQALAERSSVNLHCGLSAAITRLTEEFAIGVAASEQQHTKVSLEVVHHQNVQ